MDFVWINVFIDMRINVTAISIKIAIDKAVCEQLGILVFIVMYGACVNTKNINTMPNASISEARNEEIEIS